jgi:hypothetical protein
MDEYHKRIAMESAIVCVFLEVSLLRYGGEVW